MKMLNQVKSVLRAFLGILGYEINGIRMTPRPLRSKANIRQIEFDDIIARRFLESTSSFRFIQIGAYDGLMADPIHKYINKYGWKGVMVEPQQHAAESLQNMYLNNQGIRIIRAALSHNHSRKRMFTVNSDFAPSWVGGLASFDKSILLKHHDQVPGLESLIVEEVVDCVTFDNVLEILGSGPLDLLQIDTEGADGYILSLFPFDKVCPAIVHWEVKHLSFRDREECMARLVSFGYKLAFSGTEDMIAVL